MKRYIIEELNVNGKKYFHLYCSCSEIAGNATYSVVHLWDRLEEWIKHYEENHKCGVDV